MQKHGITFEFRPRETETISIAIPKDTLGSLNKVAASRDMSLQALLKFYIGQGLRHDLARLFGDRVLETTEQVLAKHIQSQEEISSIWPSLPRTPPLNQIWLQTHEGLRLGVHDLFGLSC